MPVPHSLGIVFNTMTYKSSETVQRQGFFFFFFFKLFIFPFLYTGATVSGGTREANPPHQKPYSVYHTQYDVN